MTKQKSGSARSHLAGPRHERAHQAIERLGRERGVLAAQHTRGDGLARRLIVGRLETQRLDGAEGPVTGADRTARPIATRPQPRPEPTRRHEGAAGPNDDGTGRPPW